MKWLPVAILAVLVLVCVAVRVRLLDFPLERDEGEYAYAGQLLLEGIPPYQLACNMKMPGIYLAYALLMGVFGQTPAGIHLGLLVVHAATLAVFYLIARIFFDFHEATIAAAAYALMTLSPAYLGLAAHATHFVMLPALLGTWMLLRIEKTARLPACFFCGSLFGVAFLMKQPGVFFGIFGGLYLAWASVGAKIAPHRVLARLGVYSLGCATPFLAVCIWLKFAGVFPQFWFWTISYAREYAAILPFHTGLGNAKAAFAAIFQAAPLLWMIAGLGVVGLCVARLAPNTRVFLSGFFVFSFLAVCPGLYFRGHYFIAFVPAVALLVGLAVSSGGQWLAKIHPVPWLRHLPLLVATVACAQSLYADRAVFFSLPPREACRAVYGVNPFPESPDIAKFIGENTRKDQRIAVIGSEPQIYFYARRHSSTAQIYTYPLMEPQPFARKMQEDMIREIEQNPPECLVFVSIPTSWLPRPDSSHLLLDWVGGYVKRNMQPVGLIQFTGPETSEAAWGNDVATTPLRSRFFVSVFKRNHQP
ncbi:MAG: glycosyltransferase family 39 protein [Terrimicrobiaceae bacterium]